jgi:hypothetical protein
MNKKQLRKTIIEYEDIILDHINLVNWLLKQKQKSMAYKMAVWNSILNKSTKRLATAHDNLSSCTGHSTN